MKPYDYAVQIFWSEEDKAYIAAPFELAGCVADGQTPEEALANLRVIIEEWIEVAKQEEREVPNPVSREDLQRMAQEQSEKQNQILRQYIQTAVSTAVQQIVSGMAKGPLRYGFNQSYRDWGSRVEFEPAGSLADVSIPPSGRGQ
jgi:predicted RNase H-like HicB family nuclease